MMPQMAAVVFALAMPGAGTPPSWSTAPSSSNVLLVRHHHHHHWHWDGEGPSSEIPRAPWYGDMQAGPEDRLPFTGSAHPAATTPSQSDRGSPREGSTTAPSIDWVDPAR